MFLPYVGRFAGVEGGKPRVALPGVLVEPWNPIAGSNWIYDATAFRATFSNLLTPSLDTLGDGVSPSYRGA
jgi:peptide/nickel transport system substrate-binding protein